MNQQAATDDVAEQPVQLPADAAMTSDMQADPAQAGYGARLAFERQRAGLSVTDIAATLRLHPNQVRAIEQEDLARLPEVAYVRGFIRSYARALSIDAAPLLSDLNAKLTPSASSVVDAMTTTSDYSPVRAAAHERTSRQLVMGAAIVGLMTLGIVGWLSMKQDQLAPAADVAAAPPPAPVVAPPIVEPIVSKTEEAPAVPSPIPSVSDESPAAPAQTVQTPMLSLRFSGPSWVEVTDANGKILLSELSSAGVERTLSGAAPMMVVIGDANVTSVSVHGEVFNLQPFTRNNVARFTVKPQ